MYIFLILLLSFIYLTKILIVEKKKNKEDFVGASYPAELHVVEPIYLEDIPKINFKNDNDFVGHNSSDYNEYSLIPNANKKITPYDNSFNFPEIKENKFLKKIIDDNIYNWKYKRNNIARPWFTK